MKQTGRDCGVKGTEPARRILALLSIVLLSGSLLSACASTWINAGKTPQEAKADERTCSTEAEETALIRTKQQKVEYGVPSPIQPGMNRGETPMQLVDRTRTEDTYTRDFESCMRSKGYSHTPS